MELFGVPRLTCKLQHLCPCLYCIIFKGFMLSVLFTGKSGPTKAQVRKKRQEDLGPRALSNKRYQKYFSEETYFRFKTPWQKRPVCVFQSPLTLLTNPQHFSYFDSFDIFAAVRCWYTQQSINHNLPLSKESCHCQGQEVFSNRGAPSSQGSTVPVPSQRGRCSVAEGGAGYQLLSGVEGCEPLA